MIRINQIKVLPGYQEKELWEKAARMLSTPLEHIEELHIVKKSIDARKKPEVFYTFSVDVKVKNEEKILKKVHNPQIAVSKEIKYHFPKAGKKRLSERPVVIGAGPGGLFCAYFLALHGYRPILLERGKDVDARQQDVDTFWEKGKLNPASNVQFGEGGAGTFSDGKLNTLIKDKDGRNKMVLKVFVECGAPQTILYDSKPHVGTDILKSVVRNMREKIIEYGGEVRFQNQVTDFVIKNEQIQAVVINDTEKLPAKVAVLAIGHSARDTFKTLYEKQIPMESKAFAVGFRVEHPQDMIDKNQYGMQPKKLPAAAYKVTAQTSCGRGVYSFCMCPGGYVVNASSEEEMLAVNGMSYSDRAGTNANSAIIVAVTPQDFAGKEPLAGIEFQRQLERKAFQAGKGKVPIQNFGSFYQKTGMKEHQPDMNHRLAISPQIKGDYVEADLSGIFPQQLNEAFVEAMEHFGKAITGFNSVDTLLAGVESRTSSPVRILRNEHLESVVQGLYPCGEGAGYAGGITSAAMDGIRIAEEIAKEYKTLD